MRSYHQVLGILWSELLIHWTIYEELSVKKNLAYTKYPVKVLEIVEQVIWSKVVMTKWRIKVLEKVKKIQRQSIYISLITVF
jgi:hypothetical protein